MVTRPYNQKVFDVSSEEDSHPSQPSMPADDDSCSESSVVMVSSEDGVIFVNSNTSPEALTLSIPEDTDSDLISSPTTPMRTVSADNAGKLASWNDYGPKDSKSRDDGGNTVASSPAGLTARSAGSDAEDQNAMIFPNSGTSGLGMSLDGSYPESYSTLQNPPPQKTEVASAKSSSIASDNMAVDSHPPPMTGSKVQQETTQSQMPRETRIRLLLLSLVILLGIMTVNLGLENSAMRSSIVRLENEKSKLGEELGSVAALASGLTQERDSWRSTAFALKEETDKVEEKYNAAMMTTAYLELKRVSMRSELLELEEEMADLGLENKSVQASIAILEDEKTKMKEELDEYVAMAASLAQEMDFWQSMALDLEEKMIMLEEKYRAALTMTLYLAIERRSMRSSFSKMEEEMKKFQETYGFMKLPGSSDGDESTFKLLDNCWVQADIKLGECTGEAAKTLYEYYEYFWSSFGTKPTSSEIALI